MLWNRDFRTVRIIEGVLLAALALAALALLLGWVRPAEVPGLLDVHVLSLFFVLIVAVECAKKSQLFAFGVRAVLARVRSARALAAAAVLLTGATAALVTNDVALLLMVPFTLAFEAAAPGFETAGLVVLEIASANLLGSLMPTGNPQNLFLFVRGGFTPGSFFGAQAPWVLGMAAATLLLVPLVVRERPLPAPAVHAIRVEPLAAAAALALIALELLAIFRAVPPAVPGVAALFALAVLGRDAWRADFSLVAVFAALFVGVEGLRRSALFHALDPIRLFGSSPAGFVVSGALLSQAVSNVPAALLLAPAAAAAPAGAFTALLYGVNAGGCGTPIASLANLIGARLYLAGRSSRRTFWRLFAVASTALLVLAVMLSLALVKYSGS
jgi:Na+/H+ antiporter NhaD/arsenite permease-like protein